MNDSQEQENAPNKVSEEQISFRLPAEERRAFAGKVKGAGKDFKDVLRSFVRSYIEDDVAEPPERKSGKKTQQYKNQEWHELLDIVLDSHTKHAVDAIQKNLEMFAFSTHVAGPKSAAEIRELLASLRKAREIGRKATKPAKKPAKNRAS